MRRPEGKAVGHRTRRATLGAVLAGVVGAAAPALVAAATSEIPVFGMLGLGAGQSATVYLVLVQPPDPAHPGCRITASFVDAGGQVFRDAAGKPFEQTFVLRDNVASALTLRSTDILTTGERRKPTRMLLARPPSSTASRPAGTRWACPT